MMENQLIKKAPRIALPLFILLAALLHLSTIYLFNIVYQVPHVSKPSTAQVFFLLPGSSASKQLVAWLQGNDPAIFSPLKTIQSYRSTLPATVYRAAQSSFLHSLPSEKPMSISPPELPLHETVLPEDALFFTQQNTEKKILPQSEDATKVSFLEGLESRVSKVSMPLLLEGMAPPIYPTTLRVNVNAAGVPRHVIIAQSSGNSAADEVATTWMMRQRFAPSAHETWGKVIVSWGH